MCFIRCSSERNVGKTNNQTLTCSRTNSFNFSDEFVLCPIRVVGWMGEKWVDDRWTINQTAFSDSPANCKSARKKWMETWILLLPTIYLPFVLFPFLLPAGENCTSLHRFSHAQCELFYWTILMHPGRLFAAIKFKSKTKRKSILPVIDGICKEVIHYDYGVTAHSCASNENNYKSK